MLLARRLSTQGAFVVRDEVRAAVAARRPVVALESTIITHGMPFPRNLEVARACEASGVRHRAARGHSVACRAVSWHRWLSRATACCVPWRHVPCNAMAQVGPKFPGPDPQWAQTPGPGSNLAQDMIK